MKLLVIAIAIATSFTACALLSDDPPDNSCKTDSDCFTGVERCSPDAGVCEPKPDAGP